MGIYQSNLTNVDFTNFLDKFFEIMEVEMDVNIKKTNSFPDVMVRYDEFSEGIGSETSSSSLLSEDRVSSPKRASLKNEESGVAKGRRTRHKGRKIRSIKR